MVLQRSRSVPLILCLLVLAPFLQGQESAAVLVQGPTQRRGLEFLPVNRLSYFHGLYRWRELQVEVFYTESDFVLKERGSPLQCGTMEMDLLTGPDEQAPGQTPQRPIRHPPGRPNRRPPVFLYRHPSSETKPGWSVFFRFSESPDDPCEFSGAFVRRLLFFLGSARDNPVLPPFPAVIQIR